MTADIPAMAKKATKVDRNVGDVIRINSWKEFRNIVESGQFDSWAFRGQREAFWVLESTLSRYLKTFRIHTEAWKIQEERIIRIFMRKAHQFLKNIPEEGNTFEWLALMQLHGAPTRLLDFTWSPYVAAFFALERATLASAIWALDPAKLYNDKTDSQTNGLRKFSTGLSPWFNKNFESRFLNNKEPLVLIGEPYRMNQRLIAQSGTFVISGVLQQPIEEILSSETSGHGALVKFELDTVAIRKEAMESLYRMNITNATLFPDLDGLARSLAFELEFNWEFDPINNRKKGSSGYRYGHG